MTSLHHEGVHYLRQNGAFSDTEWRALEARARKQWMGQFAVGRTYPDLNTEQQLEEAIAEGIGRILAGDKQAEQGLPARLIRAIRAFFARLKARLLGHPNSGQIIADIRSGRVASRLDGPAVQVHSDLATAPTPVQRKAMRDVTARFQEVLERTGDPEAAKQAAQEMLRERRAHHGSAFRFDSFDMEQVGTGEGTQNEGYGLYFTSHQGTAEQYKREVGGYRQKERTKRAADRVLGEAIPGWTKGSLLGATEKTRFFADLAKGADIEGHAPEAIQIHKLYQQIATTLRSWTQAWAEGKEPELGEGGSSYLDPRLSRLSELADTALSPYLDRLIDELPARPAEGSWGQAIYDGLRDQVEGQGLADTTDIQPTLYGVELDVDKKTLLNRDENVRGQSPEVRAALAAAYKDAGLELNEGDHAIVAYGKLATHLKDDRTYFRGFGVSGEGEKRASRLLAKHGIRGMEYREGGPTWAKNTVMFGTEHIQIRNRERRAGLSMPEGVPKDAQDALWKARQRMTDDLAGAERMMVDTGQRRGGDAFEAAQLARAASSIVEEALRRGAPSRQRTKAGEVTRFQGKGLGAILRPIAGPDYNAFMGYVAGVGSARGRPQFVQVKRELDQWVNTTIGFARSAGLMSREQAELWQQGFYQPHSYRGKGAPDPVVSIVSNAQAMVETALVNEARRELVDAAMKGQTGEEWIKRVQVGTPPDPDGSGEPGCPLEPGYPARRSEDRARSGS